MSESAFFRVLTLIPSRLSLRLAVLVWLSRAWALRHWWYCMVSAVRWNNFSVDAGSSHHDWTTALAARRIWETVTSGFFPPQPLAGNRQKQVTDRGQYQVPLQARPCAPFPMTQPHFAFLVLKATLDRPKVSQSNFRPLARARSYNSRAISVLGR